MTDEEGPLENQLHDDEEEENRELFDEVSLVSEVKTQEEEEENDNDEEEVYIFNEEGTPKIRRCQKKKKRKIRLSLEVYSEDERGSEEPDEEEEEEDNEDEEDDEDDEGKFEESETDDSESEYDSIFSSVSFEWEDKRYEFLDLCDPGTIDDIWRKRTVSMIYDELNDQKLYLQMCDELKVPPIIRFYYSLCTEKVDLTFHGLNEKQMQAICVTLHFNTYVKSLILNENILSEKSCSFLSSLLSKTDSIVNLDLSGCRIGPQGAELLAQGLRDNNSLMEINLNKCYVEDGGMQNLTVPLKDNHIMKKVILSYNKLGAGAADALGSMFYANDSIEYIDLNNNYLYDIIGMKKFFKGLNSNSSLKILHLRWNAMSAAEIGEALFQFLKANKTIQYLDLSNNRLEAQSIRSLRKGLSKSESLQVLKLSGNPLDSIDVEYLLPGIKNSPALNFLYLEDIWVRKEFMKALKKIQQVKDIEVVVGGVYSDYIVYGPDYPALLLKRAQYEAKKPKKRKKQKDFGHLMFMLGDDPMTIDQFNAVTTKFKAKISKELYSELVKQFTIPKTLLVNVVSMREKYLSLFPGSEPPPMKTSKKKEAQEREEANMSKTQRHQILVTKKKQSAAEVAIETLSEAYEMDEEPFEFAYGVDEEVKGEDGDFEGEEESEETEEEIKVKFNLEVEEESPMDDGNGIEEGSQ